MSRKPWGTPINHRHRQHGFQWYQCYIFYSFLVAGFQMEDTPNCPRGIEVCPCYKFDDGIFLECPRATAQVIQKALRSVNGPIQSFSLYELDPELQILGPELIPPGACIRHLRILQSNVKDVDDETFSQIRACLETLSIVSNNLSYVPQKAFAGLNKIIALDLEYNKIPELPGYGFFGLPIIKINVKGNQLKDIAETAFMGIEDTLSELDLSENNLEEFPLNSIKHLRLLSSLRVSWNDIAFIPFVESTNLLSLVYLDISFNNFLTITEDCFVSMPAIKTLSLRFNSIEKLNKLAFSTLKNLDTLDLSHNKIKILSVVLFLENKNLKQIDLSNNHIHHIGGVFRDLPQLHELYLFSNSILEVPKDAFTNSSKLSVIYLQDNNIQYIHKRSLETLDNLSQIHLGFNLITNVPHEIFRNKNKLVSLSLENNKIIFLAQHVFHDLKALKEINLECNLLQFIPSSLFRNCKFLEEIHLDQNKISEFDLKTLDNLASLHHVNLQSNLINNLMGALPQSQSDLASIQLDNNRVRDVNISAFPNQSRLQILSLAHNSLQTIRDNYFINLTTVEKVHLNHNSITIIEDGSFLDMKSVKYLDLRNNYIKHISNETFLGMNELEDLILAENRISNLMPRSFHMLKKIRSLDISHNVLKVIQKEQFKSGLPLRTLSLQNCSIKIIEDEAFIGLNNLNTLELQHNSLRADQITRINVPGLKTLKLSYNNLSQLDSNAFGQLPLIHSLHLDNGRINYVPPEVFSNNKKLMKLCLNNNFIQDLGSKIFTETALLTYINLSQNMLRDIPYDVVSNLSHLEVLYLSNNLIQSMDLNKLSHLKILKQLYVNGNGLKIISPYTGSGFDYLSVLDISSNQLITLYDNIRIIAPNLQNLNISENHLMRLPNIMSDEEDSKKITVDVSSNPLGSSIQTVGGDLRSGNIVELHMSAVGISSVTDETFSFLPALQHLNINCNNIYEFSKTPFIALGVLQTLDVSRNKISYLHSSNFYGLQRLAALNLSHNVIVKMEPFASDLQNLITLDLSFNEIENIQTGDLTNLFELRELYLKNNRIQFIMDRSFIMQKKLKILNLKSNSLESLSYNIISNIERQIKEFLLEGNPISCGCESRDLWLWLQEHPRTSGATQARCSTPYFLYAVPLATVVMSELCELPVIAQMEVHELGKIGMSVTWKVRNETAIDAFQVLYYADDDIWDIRSDIVDNTTNSVDVSGLRANTEYIVCVLAIHRDSSSFWNTSITIPVLSGNESTNSTHGPLFELAKTPSSECTTFSIINLQRIVKATKKGYSLSKILTRRLGLMVGCCMGVVTFILLVSILGYMKSKKRKLIPDPDQMACELHYRNSLQSSEDIILRASLSPNHSTENILLGINKKRMSVVK